MFHYERESRTPHSECYVVESDAGSRARLDLHFAPPLVYATLQRLKVPRCGAALAGQKPSVNHDTEVT